MNLKINLYKAAYTLFFLLAVFVFFSHQGFRSRVISPAFAQACDDTCDNNSQCGGGRQCISNHCRDPVCGSETDCDCSNRTICTISLQKTPDYMAAGDSGKATVFVTDEPASYPVSNVTFSSSSHGIFTFTQNPGNNVTDTSRSANGSYEADIQAIADGTANLTAFARVLSPTGKTYTCTNTKSVTIGGPTPTPAPMCRQIYLYTVNGPPTDPSTIWTQILPQTITQGDTIYLGVEGDPGGTQETFTKARFIINGYPNIETDTVIPATSTYYLEFVVPSVYTEYTIGAELFGSTTQMWY